MHAVSIEAGGIVPLPRVGGALSHAVGSIRNLPRHCQTGVCQDQPFRTMDIYAQIVPAEQRRALRQLSEFAKGGAIDSRSITVQ